MLLSFEVLHPATKLSIENSRLSCGELATDALEIATVLLVLECSARLFGDTKTSACLGRAP
eukprot:8502496-Pyramimonas_sp.AAC.1